MSDRLNDPRQTLADLIAARRSVRHYSGIAVPVDAIQRILKSAQAPSGDGKRTAPSAHALYPLELFVVARDMAGPAVAPGLYAINRAQGTLAGRIHTVAPRALRTTSLADDEWLETAAAVIVVAARHTPALAHFQDQQADGQRGRRYIDVEAGTVLQNIHLATTAEGLGGVIVMGFDDAALANVLALPDGLAPVALFCLGGCRTQAIVASKVGE